MNTPRHLQPPVRLSAFSLEPSAFFRPAWTAFALLLATALPLPAAETATAPKVREPAVAGLFYPADKDELARTIDSCLAAARAVTLDGELKALVCPHAGYSYSGPVAASGYKLLTGREYETVVVLAPSHCADFRGASVCGADLFRTPLGDVPVATGKAEALAKIRPFALDPAAFVQRPGWWRQASCPAPKDGADTAHTWEHSAEVQVPFLQRTLHSFSLLPVVFGSADPAKAAAALAQVIDDRTLVIASTDLSHYDSYDNARKRDRRCVEAICALEPEKISPENACGALPVQTLLHLAKAKGWKARLLDLRNSGDTSGEMARGVVGYAAIAFYAPAAAAEEVAPAYTPEDRRFLLGIARMALREAASSGEPVPVATRVLAPKFTMKKGCFVTLTKDGGLRGCIGHITPQEPLVEAVADNARSAAIRDPRFPPVTAGEVDSLEIEISVLTEPAPLSFSSPEDLLGRLQPGRDGVVLEIGRRGATYLPQVWEQLPDKVEFLNSLAQKAGCAPSAWRGSGVKVSVYHVESFKEGSDR